jgi:hypothetical protein
MFGEKVDTKGLKGDALKKASIANIAAIQKADAYRDKWKAARLENPTLTPTDFIAQEFGGNIKAKGAKNAETQNAAKAYWDSPSGIRQGEAVKEKTAKEKADEIKDSVK